MNGLAVLLESVNPFFLLLMAISLEITGTTALRISEGFTRILPAIWVGVSYSISFYLFSIVLKHIPMGIAYLIWGGVGGVGVLLIGMIAWHDQIGGWQVLGMILIFIGTLFLYILTPTS